MKISELIGKRVQSADGGKSGYVLWVGALGTRVMGLCCADENERQFFVDATNVVSWGDVVTFEDRERLWLTATPVRLGIAAYDRNGNFVGRVTEMEFDGGALTKATIGKRKYAANEIIVGDVVLIL